MKKLGKMEKRQVQNRKAGPLKREGKVLRGTYKRDIKIPRYIPFVNVVYNGTIFIQ